MPCIIVVPSIIVQFHVLQDHLNSHLWAVQDHLLLYSLQHCIQTFIHVQTFQYHLTGSCIFEQHLSLGVPNIVAGVISTFIYHLSTAICRHSRYYNLFKYLVTYKILLCKYPFLFKCLIVNNFVHMYLNCGKRGCNIM